jgi:hypothetical protein
MSVRGDRIETIHCDLLRYGYTRVEGQMTQISLHNLCAARTDLVASNQLVFTLRS